MSIPRKHIWAGGAIVAALTAGAVWLYVASLPVSFPELDMGNARIGKASWYSESDPGIREHTANGDIFDESDITCASWDYAFGTELFIVNPATGASVVCRVNDRGPAKRLRRVVDLSKASFEKIANRKKGLTSVIIIPVNE